MQGDPTLLRVVLENLLGNAWKYSARAHAMPRSGFERGQHEDRVFTTVRDNGAGFDMRFADRLFGVFQRLHSASDFSRAPGSVWPRCGGSSSATAARSGQSPRSIAAAASTSAFRRRARLA